MPPWTEVERHLYPERKNENPIGEISLESGLVFDLDSQGCESGISKSPGRVDVTYVLPPWPEVKGKGARENVKSNSDKGFTNPLERKRRKLLSCDCKQNSSKPVLISVLNTSCIQYKKDIFETRRDHLIHFSSKDCKFTTLVSKKKLEII